MIVPILLSLNASSAPILEEVLQLTPSAAGDLVLEGQQHATIASVLEVRGKGLQLPRIVQLELVEEAHETNSGCSRMRWTARFRHEQGESVDRAVLARTYGNAEIAIKTSAWCPKGDYVKLNTGVQIQDGFTALRQLERIRSVSEPIEFSCSDRTNTKLCSSSENIRLELTAQEPWAVSRKNDRLELWLGTPGQMVTTVRLSTGTDKIVAVSRSFPAPF